MKRGKAERRIRVLLVDADVDLRNNIESYLAMQQDIQPVGVTGDGAQALALASSCRPDVVIVDSMLPLINGLALLSRLREARGGQSAACIFLVSDGCDAVFREIVGSGADYCMVKPVNLFDLAHQIRSVSKARADIGSYRQIASSVLREMQMRVHDDGFEYAERAVAILLKHQGRAMRCKSVYILVEEETAGICHDAGKYVENDMRNAIRRAHRLRAPFYCEVLGISDSPDERYPTNSVFLSSVVQYIRTHYNLP